MQNLLSQELSAGEHIVWQGAPKKGLMLKASDIIAIPFSLMWGGFAFFWEYMAFSKNAPIFFKLWGMPFVLIGIYMIIGRFFFDAKRRSGTIYGLTNKRAIIISGFFGKQTTSINLKNIPELQVSKNADGSGTIILGANSPLHLFQSSGFPSNIKSTPAFECIENVDVVKNYIYQYQNT
jgi:hypothetical protein